MTRFQPRQFQTETIHKILNRQDVLLRAPTGSGKTESFLFPIIGHLLLEAKDRPQSWQMPGCRALLLYPMNALVSDQV
ncbi:MAG: DEAD/DEAH box helicase, partial [Microcoleus sp. T3-bin5]|nr:DEAD/DEAH box helicase [Microcoleus sp. T3-bin5]